jgi:hypothetical protein
LNRFTILVIVSAVFGLLSALTIARADHSPNLIGLLAIDANSSGNTATSIGPLDGCARVEPGARIDVDYVVDAIPDDRPMIAFQVEIRYNPALLEVVAVDYDMMLAAVGTYQPFGGGDLTDALPDTDGSYNLVVLDMASQSNLPEQGTVEANVERGKGTIARLTFQGKGSGVGEVTIGYDPAGGAYPLTQDTMNETVIADRIGGASVAVGQDCPPEAIAPKILDAPNTEEEIFAGVAPVTVAPATPTPAGQTPTVPGATPEGQTPGTDGVGGPNSGLGGPELVECEVQPLETASPSPAPAPEGSPDPAAEGPTPIPVPSEEELCTPTPAPVEDDIVAIEEDSSAGLLFGAFALLGLGTAAAGGGWYMFRRSRNGAG